MKAVEHRVTHYYQPTANSCGYAALAILLSHYGSTQTPVGLLQAVPQPKDANGQPTGSITAQLAAWLLTQEYKIDFYAFDCQILDLSWQQLSKEQLVSKLGAIKDVRHVLGLGEKYWSAVYVQAYIDYLEAGGSLTIKPHVTSSLLYTLLADGPVYANFCSATVNNSGRKRHPKLEERLSISDDIDGDIGTHSVVIYGNNENGDFLVADPWEGLVTVDCETMLCGITAAQIECDNQCFQIVTSPRA